MIAHNLKIEAKENMYIRVTDDNGGFIETQSVEACLLYAIWLELTKLKEGGDSIGEANIKT